MLMSVLYLPAEALSKHFVASHGACCGYDCCFWPPEADSSQLRLHQGLTAGSDMTALPVWFCWSEVVIAASDCRVRLRCHGIAEPMEQPVSLICAA